LTSKTYTETVTTAGAKVNVKRQLHSVPGANSQLIDPVPRWSKRYSSSDNSLLKQQSSKDTDSDFTSLQRSKRVRNTAQRDYTESVFFPALALSISMSVAMEGDYDSGVGSIDSPGDPASPTDSLRDLLGGKSNGTLLPPPPPLPRKSSLPSVARYANIEVGGGREGGGGRVGSEWNDNDPYASYSHLPPPSRWVNGVSNVSSCVSGTSTASSCVNRSLSGTNVSSSVSGTSTASSCVNRSLSGTSTASSCVNRSLSGTSTASSYNRSLANISETSNVSSCINRSSASSYMDKSPGHVNRASDASTYLHTRPTHATASSCFAESRYNTPGVSVRISDYPGHASTASNRVYRSHSVTSHASSGVTRSPGRVPASSGFSGSPNHVSRASTVSGISNHVNASHIPRVANASNRINESLNHVPGVLNASSSVSGSQNQAYYTNSVLWSPPSSSRVSPASSRASSRVSRSSGRVSGLSSRTGSFSTFSSIPEECHAPLYPPSHTHSPSKLPVTEG
jgi:hypothetical protein